MVTRRIAGELNKNAARVPDQAVRRLPAGN